MRQSFAQLHVKVSARRFQFRFCVVCVVDQIARISEHYWRIKFENCNVVWRIRRQLTLPRVANRFVCAFTLQFVTFELHHNRSGSERSTINATLCFVRNQSLLRHSDELVGGARNIIEFVPMLVFSVMATLVSFSDCSLILSSVIVQMQSKNKTNANLQSQVPQSLSQNGYG